MKRWRLLEKKRNKKVKLDKTADNQYKFVVLKKLDSLLNRLD